MTHHISHNKNTWATWLIFWKFPSYLSLCMKSAKLHSRQIVLNQETIILNNDIWCCLPPKNPNWAKNIKLQFFPGLQRIPKYTVMKSQTITLEYINLKGYFHWMQIKFKIKRRRKSFTLHWVCRART